jgi:hypothetical protein
LDCSHAKTHGLRNNLFCLNVIERSWTMKARAARERKNALQVDKALEYLQNSRDVDTHDA